MHHLQRWAGTQYHYSVPATWVDFSNICPSLNSCTGLWLLLSQVQIKMNCFTMNVFWHWNIKLHSKSLPNQIFFPPFPVVSIFSVSSPYTWMRSRSADHLSMHSFLRGHRLYVSTGFYNYGGHYRVFSSFINCVSPQSTWSNIIHLVPPKAMAITSGQKIQIQMQCGAALYKKNK